MASTAESRARADAPSTETRAAGSRRGSLAWLTARGFAWNVFGAGISQALALVATVVIARWLTPVDYAIGGLALAAVGLFQVLTANGFAGALVRLRDLTPLTCHTVFWPVAATGGLLALAVVVCAPLLADFYVRPEIVRVLPVLAVGLFASALGGVPQALLQRAMRFRAMSRSPCSRQCRMRT